MLQGILPHVYLEHHACLVTSLALLLKDTVQEDDIQKAKELVDHYCSNFATLYGALPSCVHVLCMLRLILGLNVMIVNE